MKTVTVSLRDAQRAEEVISDTNLRHQLAQTSTNTWEFDEDVEDIEDSIEDIFNSYGIQESEYEIN